MKASQLFAALCVTALSASTFAQSLQQLQQRDVNQQQRIENGLQDGSLSTREAALLERDERQVHRAQANALKDGKLTPTERQHIARLENGASRDIFLARHNGVTGNPLSSSSQRMQANVQRNINQDRRIENGLTNNSLTNREVARLDAGQARVEAKEFRAGRDGHVGAFEQHAVQAAENRQSNRIHRLKTNERDRHA